MQRLKRILLATGIFLLVMLVVGFVLPTYWYAERSVLIQAPPGVIFPYVNNLKKWREWAVQDQHRPDLATEYSGPDAGVGATSRWQDENGRAVLKIMQSERNERVGYQVLFNAGALQAQGSIILFAEGPATRVLWKVGGERGSNPAHRYRALLDRYWIGKDLAASLQTLKQKIESKN